MTTIEHARGRNRVVGPEETVLHWWVRRTSWALGLAVGVALMAWLIGSTNVEPMPGAFVVAWIAAATAFALLPARLLVGALRDAAAAGGR
jgi:hypothetical protein